MLDSTFDQISDLAESHSGLALSRSKQYLIEARLASISRRESFANIDELAHCLKARPNKRFEMEVASALTPPHTSFFADRKQAERIVNTALPIQLKASKAGRLRIWCAGASTGQEAYSLAMLIAEAADSPIGSAEIELIATDINAQSLAAAESGVFGHFDVQKGLSIQRLLAHFQRLDSGEWQATQALRDAISFRRHNLLEPAGGLGQFDVIVCRNVLSTMTSEARAQTLETLISQLTPSGLIFTAEDESLVGLSEKLEPSRDIRGAYWRGIQASKTVAA